jgi:hypothetical protein
VVQRPILYLGEINDGQREAWCRQIEAFDDPSAALQARCGPTSPALNHAPIVDLAIGNVSAECTAIKHWVGHDPRIRIADHELTAEHQVISKRLFRISRDRSGGDN